MSKATKLLFNGELMGYRFTQDGKKYDVDLDVVNKLGLSISLITKSIALTAVGDLLLSKSEIEGGERATDISHDKKLVKTLFQSIGKDGSKDTVQSSKPSKPNVLKTKSDAPKDSPLEFKNGVALVLERISKDSAEYQDIRSDYVAHLVFNTKTAIDKVCSITGVPLDKKVVLSQYERGVKSHKVRLDGNVYWAIENKLDCGISLTREGFSLISQNHYDGTHIDVQITPPQFNIPSDLQHKNIGSTANGDSLEEYIVRLKEGLQSGYYKFYPNLTISDIKRM